VIGDVCCALHANRAQIAENRIAIVPHGWASNGKKIVFKTVVRTQYVQI